jgi:hypothetical protein
MVLSFGVGLATGLVVGSGAGGTIVHLIKNAKAAVSTASEVAKVITDVKDVVK